MANIIEIIIRATGGKQVDKQMTDAQKAMRGLTAAATTLGVALGARELIAFTGESMALARAQNDARNALTSTLGSTTAYTQAVEQARTATRGMASEAELATGINTLLNMHLAASSQEAARLSMAGNTLAKVYAANGASAEKYYRLLSGGSPILYDNFGLTAEMVNAKRDEIQATTGVSAAEAKSQAIRELTIETAMRYNDALSEETVAAAQVQAASEDLKASWGDLTNQLLYGTGVVGNLATALRSLEAALEGNDEAFQQQARDILNASDTYAQYSRAMNMSGLQAQRLSKAQFESIKYALDAAAATGDYDVETRRLSAGVDAYKAAQTAATSATAAHAGWAAKAAAVQEELGDEYLVSAGKLEQYVNALARASMYGSFAPSMGMATDWQSFQDQLAMDAAHRRREAAEEQQRLDDETAREWVQSQEAATNRIRGMIESALQPTLSEVWSPPEAAMPRMDEAARRLATVATSGFGSEWLQQLNAQFQGMSFWEPIAQAMQAGDEGALREAATQLLTGPSVSQLWDKELIKQRVREQLQAENMREELVNTIQQELAAEGLNVGAGEVTGAMGGAGLATSLTGGLSEALPGALAERNLGSGIMSTIEEQMRAEKEAPRKMAQAVANALMESLPGAMDRVGGAAWEALTAGVMARLGATGMELRP